ncbi:ABC transporter permease [Roseburia hominis]
MKLEANANRNVIMHLAKSSVKNNRMRNFFAIFAIVLSVSLMTVMSLFTLGIETAEIRQVSQMQQVIYEQIEEKRAAKMAEEESVGFLMLMKSGAGIEVGNKILSPLYYAWSPLKGETGTIKTSSVKEGGRMPESYREVAVTEEYCSVAGIPAKIGTSFSITSIDGVTEEFVITGFIAGEWSSSSVYPVIFSESYAREGHMLKEVPFSALVNLKDGDQMRQDEFKQNIVELGAKYGVERKYVNENNYFTGTLKGDALKQQERMVMAGVDAGILFASILVIYSVFYLSVIGRIRQFGQLRTLGMTRGQIRRMVSREGMILGSIGIPAGLLIGGVVGYFLKPEGWDLRNTLAVMGAVAVADIVTIWLSLLKPASMAAKISPIEAAKYAGNLGRRTKEEKRSSKLKRSLTPAGLARISAARNRKKTFLTMCSLGIGGILFMIAATFVVSLNQEEYSRQSGFRHGEYVIYLSQNAKETTEHGQAGLQRNNPLNEEFKKRLLEIDGVREVFAYQNMEVSWESHGELEKDEISGFDEELFKRIQKKYADSTENLQQLKYEDMVKNDQIFVLGNSTVEEVFGWKFKIGDEVTFTFDNGETIIERECKVAGFIKNGDFLHDEIVLNHWFYVPQALLDEVSEGLNLNSQMVVSTDEKKEKTITPVITELVEENPNLILDTLKERRERDKKSFQMMYMVVLGLSLFVIGFSFLNLINTLITNIVTRKQEFAMLESVGMTRRQLGHMVSLEGILLSAGNALITLALGSAAGYGGVMLMHNLSATYMHFHFPLWFYLGYLFVLVLVPLTVSGGVLRNFEKQALTERLRIED